MSAATGDGARDAARAEIICRAPPQRAPSRDKTQSPPGVAVQPPHTRRGRQAEARVDERAQSPRANEKAPVAAELSQDAARGLDMVSLRCVTGLEKN